MTQTELLSRLQERLAKYTQSIHAGQGRGVLSDIKNTLDAFSNPYSYYACLSPEQLSQLRSDWQALADSVRPIARRRKRPGKPALAMPAAVAGFFGDAGCVPLHPRATDDCSYGCRRTTWKRAQHQRYVELNPPAHVYWIIIDCDHAEVGRWKRLGLPEPSFITVTPETQRHHVAYRLTTPVCRSATARDKPLRFLQGVALALRQVLGGDPNYVGLLTKNPLHPCWQILRSERMPRYSLQELAAAANPLQKAAGAAAQPSKAVVRPTVQLSRVEVGGRNRALFDVVRKRPDKSMSPESYALLRNQEFPEPLPEPEVRAIAHSIHRYEAKPSQYGEKAQQQFRQRQRERGAKGGRPRTAADSCPWESMDISRATWYRRRKAGTLDDDALTQSTTEAAPARVDPKDTARPWEEFGISRATWYRRQAAARQTHLQNYSETPG